MSKSVHAFQTSMSATEVLQGDSGVSAPMTTDQGVTPMSTCPWGGAKVPPWGSPGVVAAPTCSLEDVMSEELVKQLQQEDTREDIDPR